MLKYWKNLSGNTERKQSGNSVVARGYRIIVSKVAAQYYLPLLACYTPVFFTTELSDKNP